MNAKESFFEKCAFSALLIFVAVVASAMAGYAIGISITFLTTFAAIFPILAITAIMDRKLFLATLINLIFLVGFMWVSGYIFDRSYDGMHYHKQAVIMLKEGWNPLLEASTDFDIHASFPDMQPWIEHYPKGMWIFSAVLYSLTDTLETAKAVNILFVSAAFFCTFDTMKKVFDMGNAKSLFFGLLFIINPVFLCQLFTFYNDLAVGSITLIALLLCMQLYEDRAGKTTYGILFLITVISALIKFTAPALLAIIYIIFGIACAIKQRKNPEWMIKPIAVIVSGFVVSVAILGFDPYTEHLIDGKNIVHPMLGEEKHDIINSNRPTGFDDKNSIERLVISMFAESDNTFYEEPKMKIPFFVYQRELDQISMADVRVGGFGVFFSGIFIVGLILLAIIIPKNNKFKTVWKIALLTLAGLMLFFPESWWARYASFIFYIPLFAIACSVSLEKMDLLAWACTALVIINSSLIFSSVIDEGLSTTEFIQSRLDRIKKEDKKIVVRVNAFPSHLKLFEENGIYFEEYDEAIGDGETVLYRNTKYKFVD